MNINETLARFYSYQEKFITDITDSGPQRRENPISSKYTLTIYDCLSKLFDLKFCVTNDLLDLMEVGYKT